ncbi:MAG: hypothetical protein DDT33_00349 [Firmicutes bacterium]|nr:hypothetical protein [Bacillota bacterium]
MALMFGKGIKKGEAHFLYSPPHDRNTYPYHGEGDRGGEVDKQT